MKFRFHTKAPLAAAAICLSIGTATAEVFVEGNLARQATIGFSTNSENGQLVISAIDDGSPAATGGLREGDTVLAINGEAYDKDYAGRALLGKLKAGQNASLAIERDGERLMVSFSPAARPYEGIEGLDSYYGVVDTSDGSRLRTIITKPEGVEGPLPAIFFTQWVSCGSLEYVPGSTSREIMATIAKKSGMAFIRVERTTSGDSEGPSCHELDYNTELQHYFEAYQALKTNPHIDADNLVIIGSSLGSTTAPLLAQRIIENDGAIKGIAVQGGGAVTYLERMINFDRIYLERRPEVDPRTIHGEMINRIRFQYEYLINDRDPDDIAEDSAEMAAVRADTLGLGDGQQYGRPYAWHQQAAKHDFLAAWMNIEAPVLVVFNEYDQYEVRHGHRMIVDFINRQRPGTATYIEQAGIGHSEWLYPSAVDAYIDQNGLAVPHMKSNRMVSWLKQTVIPTFD